MKVTDAMVAAYDAGFNDHDCGPGDCCTKSGLARVVGMVAAAERERVAAYISRAATRKREQAETWFSSDALIANAYDTVAGWCRDETIWND